MNRIVKIVGSSEDSGVRLHKFTKYKKYNWEGKVYQVNNSVTFSNFLKGDL